nr:hypothetical protein [uncultured Sphingomonas sp.]
MAASISITALPGRQTVVLRSDGLRMTIEPGSTETIVLGEALHVEIFEAADDDEDWVREGVGSGPDVA